MFKVLTIKEDLGGSLAYQAAIKERVFRSLEAQLNKLEIEGIVGVFPSQSDSEFQVVAVVKVSPAKEKAKGGK